MFLLPSKKKEDEWKKKTTSCLYTCSHQEGIVFGLCSVFFYFSFFLTNLHGVMFALAGVVSGQWLAHWQGSGQGLPSTRQYMDWRSNKSLG